MKETISIEELLSKYRRYIIKVASTLTNDDYIKQELIQEANIGIWKAYQRFDSTEGTLHSYLINYIRGSMLNYLTTSIRTVKPSASLIHHINRTEGEELSKTISMDIIVEDGYNLSETISMEEEDTSTDDQQELVRALLNKYISELKEQWQKIVTMRYMQEMSLDEIAEQLNITRQAVALQHDSAIKKLQELFNVSQTTNHIKFKRVKEQKRPNKK
jgi:RNA polymerase sigma factor (sigma-70 family)